MLIANVNANVYTKINFREKLLFELVEKSIEYLRDLKKKGFISEKELKYFLFEFKKATNLGKMYLLPKLHKRLYDVPRRPVISNCGKPTERV